MPLAHGARREKKLSPFILYPLRATPHARGTLCDICPKVKKSIMNSIKIMLLFSFITICWPGCTSTIPKLNLNFISFSGYDYKAFQIDEFRIYLMKYKHFEDTCNSADILEKICSNGELNGAHFWMNYLDVPSEGLFQVKAKKFDSLKVIPFIRLENYSTTFKDSIGTDLETFNGRIVFVGSSSLSAIQHGIIEDTLQINMIIDRKYPFPGPVDVFTVHLLCEPNSDPCTAMPKRIKFLYLTYDGCIL